MANDVVHFTPPVKRIAITNAAEYEGFTILTLSDYANNGKYICRINCDPEYAKQLITLFNTELMEKKGDGVA